jgi:hypothetical protein
MDIPRFKSWQGKRLFCSRCPHLPQQPTQSSIPLYGKGGGSPFHGGEVVGASKWPPDHSCPSSSAFRPCTVTAVPLVPLLYSLGNLFRCSEGKNKSGLWYPSLQVQTWPKPSDFFGWKIPQHAFLRKGSKVADLRHAKEPCGYMEPGLQAEFVGHFLPNFFPHWGLVTPAWCGAPLELTEGTKCGAQRACSLEGLGASG